MQIRLRLPFLAVSLCLGAAVPGLPAQAPAPPPEARQFDFWVGRWDVFAPDGRKAGENLIEIVGDGWGLLENWTGSSGGSGKSLNTWIPGEKQWRQFWIGAGGALELTGTFANGRMVLAGRRTDEQGKTTIDRITWTPKADGSVRQLWEQSTDEGKSWTTAFDGLYRKKPE